MTKREIARIVVCWILALWLAFVFGRAGIAKFDPASGWSRSFERWGFPEWFRLLIGVAEVAAAALILLPRTSAYGAAIMVAVMIGATGNFAVRGTFHHIQVPIIAGLIAAAVLALRWRDRLPLSRSTPLPALPQ